MMRRMIGGVDPLVRLLLLAILLATFLPVKGEAREVAQHVSNAAVFLLFLLNGLRLPRGEVLAGIANWRFLVPLVLWCFGAMALAGWGMAQLLTGWLPAMVALGFLYLGALPGTVQSATAYCSVAKGNVASSVVAAALLNILGVFLTAPIFTLMAGTFGQVAGEVGIDASGIVKVALILILPFLIGQIAQNRLGHFIREHRQIAGWMDRTAIAIAVYVAFSAAVEQGIWSQIDPATWAVLLGGVIAFLAIGFWGSWLLGGAIGLQRGDRIAMLFSGGQKSIAMGAPLAAVLFPPAVAGIVLLPTLVYHLLQLVISAPIASRLARD